MIEGNEHKKIKVGTMTFHMAHNYGAMLQAYGLERAISSLGYTCEVVDYRFPHIDHYNCIWDCNDYVQREGNILGVLKYIKRCLTGGYKNITPLHKKFDSFMRKSLKLSKRAYFKPELLREAEYDYVFFGSDQIWNPDLTGGVVPEYFGKYFDTTKIKLVSYAASSGTDCIKPECKEIALPLLKKFKKLGIREDSLTQFLKKDYGLDACTVVDPVFLLERKEWDKLIEDVENPVKEPYLLIYAFQEGQEIYQLARRIASEKGLKLVTVSYREKENLDDMLQLIDCGPKEFVSLIKNADFICTTSFHGTAFSVLYEKDFYCIGHPLYSQRNWDLLNMIDMGNRMISGNEDVSEVKSCDYSRASELLHKKRQESLEFIKNALS